MQSALFSMDVADGAVKAMVGGKDFRVSQFNRAVQSQTAARIGLQAHNLYCGYGERVHSRLDHN